MHNGVESGLGTSTSNAMPLLVRVRMQTKELKGAVLGWRAGSSDPRTD
jgi:hypothetical protein